MFINHTILIFISKIVALPCFITWFPFYIFVFIIGSFIIYMYFLFYFFFWKNISVVGCRNNIEELFCCLVSLNCKLCIYRKHTYKKSVFFFLTSNLQNNIHNKNYAVKLLTQHTTTKVVTYNFPTNIQNNIQHKKIWILKFNVQTFLCMVIA